MKVLLDTNIIIHRETKDPINQEIGKLFWWFDKLNYKKCIHDVTIKEISKNKDEEGQKAFLIKIQNYNKLQTTAPLKNEVKKVSDKFDNSDNDKNDTILINELYSNRVDYLITEDKKIHDKSTELGINERTFTIDQFLEKVNTENPSFVDYDVLSIEKDFFGNIDLNDNFFDSFKEDYIGFDEWFNSKSEEPVYFCKSNGKIIAFLYLKVEHKNEPYNDIKPTFTRKKRLKIGTLKVDVNGLRLGERLIKIFFDNALKQSVEEIYVTTFTSRLEHERLINLFAKFGFKHHGIKETESGIEEVYTRDMTKKITNSKPKYYYPYIPKNTKKYLVSIYPEYHTELLPDSILTTESHIDFVDNEPYRNAIEKIFVSRSINRNMKTGDIIIFYRTGGGYRGVITTIGIVESINTSIKDEKQFIDLCRKRSVFSDEKLKEQWNYNPRNRPFIVNFLYLYSFPKRVNLNRLIELGITDSAPRGFERISDDSFNMIIKETNTNGNIIIN